MRPYESMRFRSACLALTAVLSLAFAVDGETAEPRVKWCGNGGDSCDQPGRGYTMCERFKSALDSIPAEESLPVCDLKLPKQFSDFGVPQWESMPIAENMRAIYDMEMWLVVPSNSDRYYSRWKDNYPDSYWIGGRDFENPATWRKVPYEAWLTDYSERVKSGEIEPRLSAASVVLHDGRTVTLLRYERVPGGDLKACQDNVSAKHRYSDIGSRLFLAGESRDTPVRLLLGGYPTGDVITYKGKAVVVGGSGPHLYAVDLAIALPTRFPVPTKNLYVSQRCGLRDVEYP